MKVYAYCRVSSLDQNPTMQEDAILKRYPKAKVLTEKKSGTTTKGREQLETILSIIDKGEKLVVWKLDRLARNMKDLLDIVEEIEVIEIPGEHDTFVEEPPVGDHLRICLEKAQKMNNE